MDTWTGGVHLRRGLLVGIGTAAMVMPTAACRTSDTAPAPPLEMSCDDPVATDLGVPTVRRLARLTTSGGRLRFVVTDLPPGSVFGEIEDTEVRLADPAAPTEALFRVTVSPQQPGVVDVEAGTYSVLNTHNGGIAVEACPDVTLAGVRRAIPDPGAEPFEPATPSG